MGPWRKPGSQLYNRLSSLLKLRKSARTWYDEHNFFTTATVSWDSVVKRIFQPLTEDKKIYQNKIVETERRADKDIADLTSYLL